MYYYAILNRNGIITSTYASHVKMRTSKYLVEISAKDMGKIGKQFWACSTDNVQYMNTSKSLSDKLEEIDTELSAESGNVASLVSEVADVKAIAENAEAEAGNNTAAIGSVRVDIQLAKDRMDGIADQVSAVISSVGDARHELGQLEADYTETKAKTEEALKTADTDIKALDSAVADNQKSITNLVTAVSGNAIDIQDIKAENIQQKARVNELDDALYAFKDETAKNIEHINKNFQQINANFDGVREDISGLTEKQDRTDNSINVIWADIRIKEAEMADYKAETAENFAEVQNTVNNLDSRASANAGDIASLIGSMNNAENSISTLAERMSTAENDISDHSNSINSLANRVTNAESKLNTATSNISNLTNRTTAAEKAIDSVESEISAVKADMTNYLPVTGGTVSGDLDVSGVLRMRGSQAFFYNVDAKTMNIGTNNATVVNMAGVHSGGTMNINSATLRPYNVIPRDNNSLLGNSNYRWKGIYSQAAVNVSSDERLKKDIAETDSKELAEFINKLPVKTYKYKDDEMNIDRIGLIAQDIIKADPKLSRYFVSSEGDGFYSLKPADLVFPLIAAVQQLSEKIEELKK